jgi:hypothetical protein
VCALALVRAGTCGAQEASAPPDTQFANFAFASELGSGIYEIGGSIMQVYQLPFFYTVRPAERPGGRPGVRIIFPTTVGFFNFQTSDLVHLDIPDSIGALSIEPGVQLDYWLKEDWHVYPYAKAGATFASSAQVNALIYGVGLRSDYRFSVFDGAGLYRAELLYAGVHYYQASDVPDDSFTRVRNGVELRHRVGRPINNRWAELGVYAVLDIYANPPSGPASGISTRTLQGEFGLMFGTNPTYQIFGLDLPRLGIGYRVAGALSGWRIVFGSPF